MVRAQFLKLGLIHVNVAWIVRFDSHPAKDEVDIDLAIQNQKQSMNHSATSTTIRVQGETARRLKHWLHTNHDVVDVDAFPESFDTSPNAPSLVQR
jgi:hypothetical protein